MSRYRYTEDELINILKSLTLELGHSPTVMDLKASQYKVSAVTYASRFGSWSKALKKAGLSFRQKGFKSFNEKKMLDNLRRLAKELGHAPTVRECDECSYTCSSQYYRKKYGSWGGALQAAKVPKKDSIAALQRLAKELGHTPTIQECDACRYTPSNTFYRSEYGSWGKVLAVAGLKKKTDKSEMILSLKRLADELGHKPTVAECDRCPYTPSYHTFCKKFGSWNNAIKEASLI